MVVFLVIGCTSSFGLFFAEFMVEFRAPASSITIALSVQTIVFSVSCMYLMLKLTKIPYLSTELNPINLLLKLIDNDFFIYGLNSPQSWILLLYFKNSTIKMTSIYQTNCHVYTEDTRVNYKNKISKT